ncbi:MAG: hypothetical protein K2M78_07825 [Lachnospiraceae bacterium]|nr:hypothetical protein [Lachnospiraceae bacterium]
MKKKSLVIAFLLIILLSIIFVVVFIRNKENKRLEITTIINTRDNYKCQVSIEDEDIVKYVKNYSLNDKENLDDDKEHINFVFEGLNEGRTTVTIKCISTIDDSVLNEETYKVMVNKKLDTSIYVLEK